MLGCRDPTTRDVQVAMFRVGQQEVDCKICAVELRLESLSRLLINVMMKEEIWCWCQEKENRQAGVIERKSTWFEAQCQVIEGGVG